MDAHTVRELAQLSGGPILLTMRFAPGSAVLPKEATAAVRHLAVSLRGVKRRLVIVGHTDNVGQPQYNLLLSERRAAYVTRLLTTTGVPHFRIAAHGRGPLDPTADNFAGVDARALNRRVEIQFEHRPLGLAITTPPLPASPADDPRRNNNKCQ